MSGRPDFDAGDLVVCVYDGPCRITGRMPLQSRRGAAVRVGRMVPPYKTIENCWGFAGVGDPNDGSIRAAYRYRKIDRADDDFTASIRAMRPAGVPA